MEQKPPILDEKGRQQFDVDGMIIWATSFEEALDIVNLAIIDTEEVFKYEEEHGQDVLR